MLALDTPAWPPPPEVAARMQALEQVLHSTDATPAQREAARSELARLLKSPAGQLRGRDEKPARPARAAIEPFPSVVKPLEPQFPAGPRAQVPGVAHVEVVQPPKAPVADPRTGSAPAPSGPFAVDPLTGHVLHPVPGGYVDPITGQFVPR